MKLCSSPRSPFVRKVLITLYETDLYDQVEMVRWPVAMATPNLDLAPHNPLIKLPTLLLENGTAVYDSRVICEYLAHLANNTELFPVHPGPRFQALQEQALGDGLMDLLLLWRQEKNKEVERQTSAWLDAFSTKTDYCLRAIDKIFAASMEKHYTIGHLSLGVSLSYLDFRFPDLDWRAQAPAAATWYSQVFSKRDSSIKTAPQD